MDFITILFIAIGLSMDAFAVCLGVGATPFSSQGRVKFRLAFHFGFFQFMMPILGWLAGSTILRYISAIDHWIALALLSYVGINMIRSGLRPGHKETLQDPSRGKSLIALAVATSIDALAVGLSLAALRVTIFVPSLIIGIVTGSLSLVGLFAGRKLGEKFGSRMEIVGGVILIAIGLRVLITHLLGAG